MSEKIKEKILEAIARGEVKMRPRWQFMLKAILGAVGGLAMLVVVLYLASFVFFVLRQSGLWFALGLGRRGWSIFFGSLPWVLILSALVLAAALEIAARKYTLAYRKPLLYSAVAILAAVALGAFLLAGTPLHARILRYVQEKHPPLIGGFYLREFRPGRIRNVHPGNIISVHERGFRMMNRMGEILDVEVASSTRLGPGLYFNPDDPVVIFGEKSGGRVKAFGVRKMGRGMMMK